MMISKRFFFVLGASFSISMLNFLGGDFSSDFLNSSEFGELPFRHWFWHVRNLLFFISHKGRDFIQLDNRK